MREIPILLQPEMVQATMADRKTMTRRTRGLDKVNENPNEWLLDGVQIMGSFIFHNRIAKEEFWIKCPYGQPGDLLWVREKFRKLFNCQTGEFHSYCYYADMPELFHQQQKKKFPNLKWKPSIHMPKAAARILLRVLETRIERLHDISEEDAIAEGVEQDLVRCNLYDKNLRLSRNYLSNEMIWMPAKISFLTLWQYINGEDSWNANPWVWVIKFEVLSKTGKPC